MIVLVILCFRFQDSLLDGFKQMDGFMHVTTRNETGIRINYQVKRTCLVFSYQSLGNWLNLVVLSGFDWKWYLIVSIKKQVRELLADWKISTILITFFYIEKMSCQHSISMMFCKKTIVVAKNNLIWKTIQVQYSTLFSFLKSLHRLSWSLLQLHTL